MLLDKGESSLYLSYEIPDLNFLKALYIEIWIAVHGVGVQNGTETEIDLVHEFIRGRIETESIKIPVSL